MNSQKKKKKSEGREQKLNIDLSTWVDSQKSWPIMEHGRNNEEKGWKRRVSNIQLIKITGPVCKIDKGLVLKSHCDKGNVHVPRDRYLSASVRSGADKFVRKAFPFACTKSADPAEKRSLRGAYKWRRFKGRDQTIAGSTPLQNKSETDYKSLRRIRERLRDGNYLNLLMGAGEELDFYSRKEFN